MDLFEDPKEWCFSFFKLVSNLVNTKQTFLGAFSGEFSRGSAETAQIPAFGPRDMCLARVRHGYCQAGGDMGLGCARNAEQAIMTLFYLTHEFPGAWHGKREHTAPT